MQLRYAKKKDFEKFLVIKNEFFRDYGLAKKSKDFIRKEFDKFLLKCIILLENDNETIGYLFGSIEKEDYETYGYIWEMFISKNNRSKGYATLLKDKFLEYLKKNKVNICRLDVSPKKEALNVYIRWGFKTDKYRMTLRL